MQPTAEPPPVVEPAANPVLPANFSNDNFNSEMAKAGVVNPVVAPEIPVETAPDPAKPIVVAPGATKDDATIVPPELIDGEPTPTKVDDAIAEIEAMVLPKNAKAEQVASFAKLKETATKTITEKLARISELETKSSTAASKAEIEAAEARVKSAETRSKELELTVERLAYTESPKFKQFITEETASLDGAKAYLNGSEINPDVIDLAARTVGPNRIKLLKEAGLESDSISAIAPYLAQYDSIQRQKAASLENWKSEATQHQQAEQQRLDQVKAQRTAQEDQVWQAVVSKATGEILALRKSEGNDAWNGQGEAIATRAKAKYNGDGVALEDLAQTILKGEAYDVLDRAFQTMKETNKSLSAENAKLKAAKPAGPISSGGDVLGAVPANATPVERSKATFRQEMAAVSTPG